MSRPLAQFYVDVLSELGVVGIDRSASAEDRAVVERIYASVHGMLDDRDLVDWASDEAIPNKAVVAVKAITAFYSANEFAISSPRYDRLRADGELGAVPPSSSERYLVKLATGPYTSSTLETNYF